MSNYFVHLSNLLFSIYFVNECSHSLSCIIALVVVAQEIFESSGFMDALSSTDVILGRRKRKISALQTVKPNTSTATVVPPSPEDKKPQPPSVCKFIVSFFYAVYIG